MGVAAPDAVKLAKLPLWSLSTRDGSDNGPGDWMDRRLAQFERVLTAREWLAVDRFTVADLLMADILRFP